MNHDRVPVCHRCRVHQGIIGVYDPDLQANTQVCYGCLTVPERMKIDAARIAAAAEPTLFDKQFGNNGPWRDQG